MRQSNYFFKNKLHAQLVAIAIAAAVGTTKYPRRMRTTREWIQRIAVGIWPNAGPVDDDDDEFGQNFFFVAKKKKEEDEEEK